MIPTFVDNTPAGCHPVTYAARMRELMAPLDVVYVLTDTAPRAMLGMPPGQVALLTLFSEIAMFGSLHDQGS